jgi:hypothetical protein
MNSRVRYQAGSKSYDAMKSTELNRPEQEDQDQAGNKENRAGLKILTDNQDPASTNTKSTAQI